MRRQSVRYLHVSWFGLAMGVAGLAGVLRAAVLPLGVSLAVAHAVGAIAIVFQAALLAVYAVKLARYPGVVLDDFQAPTTMGFAATLPVSLLLVSGCLAAWQPDVGRAIWWCGGGLLVLLQVLGLARWLAGGIDFGQMNTGWMILALGGLPAPASGSALALEAPAGVLFGIAVAASPLMLGLLFWRTVAGPVLPPAMRPTSFILLVPPALIYAGYPPSGGEVPFWVTGSFYLAVVLTGALMVSSRTFVRWPFGAPWAAFTFPLTAVSSAAVRHLALNTSGLSAVVGWLALLLAAGAVTLVLSRALLRLARGELLQPPPLASVATPPSSHAIT